MDSLQLTFTDVDAERGNIRRQKVASLYQIALLLQFVLKEIRVNISIVLQCCFMSIGLAIYGLMLW